MIDKFSKEDFEAALTQASHMGYEDLGLDKGEEVYVIPVTESARIKVRSSIDNTGFAADSGEDSIRLWIEVFKPHFKTGEMAWLASGKKVDAYTTRVSGWEDRMAGKITVLWDRARQVRRPVGVCPKCGKAPYTGFTKAGKNEGRPYASHPKPCDYFKWLDEPVKAGEVVKFDEPEPEDLKPFDAAKEKAEILARHSQPKPDPKVDEPLKTPNLQAIKTSIKQKKAAKARKTSEPVAMTYERQPNDSQLEAIEADPSESTRLLAPPGSGKTFVIENRYSYLLNAGVRPDSILVVTFSKKMADEMLSRILGTCPDAFGKQISTIHALAYRIVSFWDNSSPYYGWDVVKSWQQKKSLDALIEKHWPVDEETDEQQPGYAEVLSWINQSKYEGLTVDKSLNFFNQNLGNEWGKRLYQIRKAYDAEMSNSRLLSFADMMYFLERRLVDDPMYRSYWQSRFNHVIVDEAQDTNYQAMRILITLSLAPGANNVYDQLTI